MAMTLDSCWTSERRVKAPATAPGLIGTCEKRYRAAAAVAFRFAHHGAHAHCAVAARGQACDGV